MKYMFGYGSIMNQTSLAKTIPDPSAAQPAELRGYQRKCNASYNGYLYMNVIPAPQSVVQGVLVPITDQALQQMKAREVGYDVVDVSDQITPPVPGTVILFQAPDVAHPSLTIPRSYLATCTRDMTDMDRATWIAETIIENEVIDDLADPVYGNAAF